MPKVTVAIAVYNGANFIHQTINSVLNQSFQDFEIIVIDDGSIDQTVNIIKSFENERIKLFENKTNKGLIYTRNKYLQLANGEYIAILDADDVWYPNKLAIQVDFMDSNTTVGISGTYANRDSIIWKFPLHHEDIKVSLLFGSAFIHSSAILRKSYIDKFNLNYRTPIAQDYDFLTQAIQHFEVVNLPKPLLKYTIHENQITFKRKKEQYKWSNSISINYLKTVYKDLCFDESTYSKLLNHDYTFTKNELIQINNIFSHISNNNVFFNQFSLDGVLAERFFLCCYHSLPKSKGRHIYYQSKFKDLFKINWILYSKFRIKALR